MDVALVTTVGKDKRAFGAENLYTGLEMAIRDSGHNVRTFPMAIDESTWEGVLEGYLSCYDLNLDDFDLVISTKAPTYMVRHRYHVSYLLHTMRVFYDMFDIENPSPSPQALKRRKLIHAFDNYGLSPERIKQHYSNGDEVALRLKKWNNITATTIHHPPRLDGFYCEGDNHIFMPGRLHRWKRVDLMIEAMRSVTDDVKLLIGGTGDDEERLRELAAGDPRIEFLGYVDDKRMLELYANALLVPFLPQREDYGLITIEAMKSKKPVITCADSGETLAFVKDGETGFIVPPEPRAIAEKVTRLIRNKDEARVMGEKGSVAVKYICWENMVRELVAKNEKDALAASKKRKTRIMVTDNQMLTPAVGGGRVRILYLYKDLPPEYDVTYVGAYDHPGPVYREHKVTENFLEIVVPLTQIHFRIEALLRKLARNKVIMDVTIPLLMRFSPRFMDKADEYTGAAKIIVIAHPWVFPWIKCSDDQLLVYDSQNCEYLVKKQILNDTLIGKWLVKRVGKIERELSNKADLILACSEEDKVSFVNIYGVSADKIEVVPNGVSITEVKPAEASAAHAAKNALKLNDRIVVLFIGSGYGPNTEGLSFIVDKLATQLPDCSFVVMGNVKDSYLAETGKSEQALPQNVRLLGILDSRERDELYAASDIAVNPMFRGSGTNIKMLDYFAAGLPVVSTPVGARGLEMENGTHGVICDPDEFVRGVDELAKNSERRLELGANARRLAEEKYDWKVIASGMLRRLEQLAEKKKFGKI